MCLAFNDQTSQLYKLRGPAVLTIFARAMDALKMIGRQAFTTQSLCYLLKQKSEKM